MARKIKNPVVVTMTKDCGERLLNVLYVLRARDTSKHLYGIALRDIETQVGRSFTMELSRKDALAMHNAALRDIQMGGRHMTDRCYTKIEKAFRDAYDARLRAMCGE
jgi:hypothetical protein